jgi:hypothetical protein
MRLGRDRIDAQTDELVLAEGTDGGERVVLRSHGVRPLPSIRESEQLVLRGEGYPTRESAEAAASRWSARLRVSFAASLVGADFGLRAPQVHFTEYGLKWFEEQRGGRVLPDVHGVLVFECDPPAEFLNLQPELIALRGTEQLLERIAKATEKDVTTNDTEELAYDLFSGSFFEPAPDGRFLMLTMAVETLARRELRAEAAIKHVDQLIADTRAITLPADERDSLLGALETLKTESTSRACQRLAQKLGDRMYDGRAPASFFSRCYRLRSKLVHGEEPRPTFGEINGQVADLERFVSDLLSLGLE